MREPDLILSPKRIIVYCWQDADTRPLYVGMSTVGLARPLDRNHVAYNQGVKLVVWHCTTKERARKLESHLIQTLNPPINKLQPYYQEWISPPPFGSYPLAKKSESQTKSEIQTVTESHSSTDERLPGHKPGCGCLPSDWEEGCTIRAVP